MNEQKIDPQKITKPIQLLAAWLVGLVTINAIFLGMALKMEIGSWERASLVVASILNVPGFVWALFTLQTKFRAELQDDTHYSAYLSKKSSGVVLIDREPTQIEKNVDAQRKNSREVEHVEFRHSVANVDLEWSNWAIGLNVSRSDFADIRQALKAAGIPVRVFFGDESDPPSKWIISLSHAMPIMHKAEILRTVLPFGFDGIQLWTPRPDADENEDVYIGSYGDGAYAAVTPELTELLKTDIEEVDLKYYCKRHRVPRKKKRIVEEEL